MNIDNEAIAKSSVNKRSICATILATFIFLFCAVYCLFEIITTNHNPVSIWLLGLMLMNLFFLAVICADFKRMKDEINTELRLTKNSLLILKNNNIYRIIPKESLKLSVSNHIPAFTICTLFDNKTKVKTFSNLNLEPILTELNLNNKDDKNKSLIFIGVVCLFSGIFSGLSVNLLSDNLEYNKAIRCLNDNRIDEAIIHLDKTVTSCRKGIRCAESYSIRGHIKEYNLNNKQSALLDYEQALRLFDEIIKAKNKQNNDRLYIGRAIVKYDLDDKQGALKDYDTALKINPKNIRTYNLRALLKIELKDYNGGLEDLNKIEELNPHALNMFKDTYYYRGKAKYELKDIEGAKEDYNKAIKKFPDENFKWYANK